jgi:putative addiction module component (TIGR02574 family)
MKKNISVSDIIELSVAERIEFVEDVWDSITQVPESVEVTQEQKSVLEERLATYHTDPDAGSPWDEVKKRIRGRK